MLQIRRHAQGSPDELVSNDPSRTGHRHPLEKSIQQKRGNKGRFNVQVQQLSITLDMTPHYQFRPRALMKDLFTYFSKTVKKLLKIDENKLDFNFARNLAQNIFNNIQIDIKDIHIELNYDKQLFMNLKNQSVFKAKNKDSALYNSLKKSTPKKQVNVFQVVINGVSIRTVDQNFEHAIFFNIKDPKNKDRPISKLITFRHMTLRIFPDQRRRMAETVFDFSFQIKILIHTKKKLEKGEVNYSAKMDINSFEVNFKEEYIEYIIDIINIHKSKFY